jgi:hypothetical protein
MGGMMRRFVCVVLCVCAVGLGGCRSLNTLALPTDRPTPTETATATPTRAGGAATAAPTITATRVPMTGTAGPSPTALLGPTSTSAGGTATRAPAAGAPRIEFFTSDVLAVAPGGTVTLFWSTRGADNATIYRLDARGNRAQLWNVGPDGNLTVATRSGDRGSIEFVLSVGDAPARAEQSLSIPIACPDTWFFQPSPSTCPSAPATASELIEQPFERGRMLYIADGDFVYALFNDGREPVWVRFQNQYDPINGVASDPSFQPPPGFYQPIEILGLVWRGNDTARNRLGLAIAPEAKYNGFIQTFTAVDGANTLYASSVDGSVLQLPPAGGTWQIITPP